MIFIRILSFLDLDPDEQIIIAARSLIERLGVESLSMQAVGTAVGIKAPSLYKRFADREAIIRGVQIAELQELTRQITNALQNGDGSDAIRTIAKVYWDLAKRSPNVYQIVFSVGSLTTSEDIAIRTSTLSPLFDASRALVGPGTALAAARTFASYIHGFLMLKLCGAFDKTPGIEGSYFYGLNAIIKGMKHP